jgi:hypothetical protein
VSCKLKTAIVLVMLALVPLRALATVTTGFCSLHRHGHALSEAAHGHHDQGGHSHDGNEDQCNSCVEHCASASVVASSELASPAPAGAHRIATPARFTAGFVPDPLDPPPLAL